MRTRERILKKRLSAIALCVLMAVTLLPTPVLAANATSVYVNGVELNSATPYWKNGDPAASSDPTGYNAFFDTSTSPTPTLRLNGCIATTGSHEETTHLNARAAIYANGDITLELKNTNTVTGPNITDGFYSIGLYISNGSLTVQGDGTLIAYGGDTTPGGISYGVRTKSITVSSGTLTAEGGTAQTTSFGVYCDGGSITVTGGTLTAKGGATTMDSYGAQAGASGITVSGGTFTAEGGTANGGNSNGVYSYDHIIVSGGTFKATGGTASSGDSHGIKVGSGVSITLTGGSTTAIGNTAAVNKSPDFTNAVQTDPYWYLWKESTTTTAPTGDFNSSSNTSTYTYNSGHKYLEFKSKTPLTGISLSTNDPQVGTAINATNLLPSGATASYQWYTNSSASVTGGTLATGTGNNTASYTPISSDAGKYLYVVATGTGNYNGTASAVTSNQVGISPSINTQPTNQTIAEGQTTTFTVSATGYPTPSYKWEVSDGGGVWTEISAVTGASYTTSAATTDMNGFKYRCIVSNSAGSVTSDEVTLTVTADPPSSENKISGITAGEVYTSGDTVTFTASGGGIPNESPKTGDKWWLPTAWETNPSGNFTGGYTQSFSTEGMSVGDHTLTVTFTQQSYNGTAWENTLISDNKTVSFTVRAATTSPETGDSASIYLYGVVMLIASGSMIWLLTAKKKKAKA